MPTLTCEDEFVMVQYKTNHYMLPYRADKRERGGEREEEEGELGG
jgi:hypothetical protein